MPNINGAETDASASGHMDAAESLLSAANDAAGSLKTLFFSYVTALTYAVISVAGVTDDQLFKQTPLSLPILDVNIPLVQYFAILPLVVLLVHLQLLLQSALLSNKVNEFHHELLQIGRDDQDDLRLRLEDFMLPRLLAGSHSAILRCLLFLLIYTSLVVLPLFTLLLIQAQFLAYHSESMMWWHRILVTSDAVALLYFWPNLFHRKDIKAGAWLKLLAFRVFPRVLLLLILLGAVAVALTRQGMPLTTILLALAGVLVGCIAASICARSIMRLEADTDANDSMWRNCVKMFESCSRCLTRITWVAILLALLSLLVATGWRECWRLGGWKSRFPLSHSPPLRWRSSP